MRPAKNKMATHTQTHTGGHTDTHTDTDRQTDTHTHEGVSDALIGNWRLCRVKAYQ